MTRRLAICLSVMLGAASVAHGAPTKVGFGLFVPEVPFAGPEQRFAAARAVAQHLSLSLGVPVEAHAYKSTTDLERDLRGKKIHFAVVGPFFAAAHSEGQVLAMAKLRSAADAMWSLMSATKVPFVDLKGATLQLPSAGSIVADFAQNGLLDGVIDLKKYFEVKSSPDLASAVTAVKLRHAKVALAPTSTPGLVAVVGAVRVPPPVFVAFKRKLSPEIVAKAAKAMLSYGGSLSSIQGWKVPDGSLGALVGASRKRVRNMAMAPAAAEHLSIRDLLPAGKVSAQLPRMEDVYWVP